MRLNLARNSAADGNVVGEIPQILSVSLVSSTCHITVAVESLWNLHNFLLLDLLDTQN